MRTTPRKSALKSARIYAPLSTPYLCAYTHLTSRSFFFLPPMPYPRIKCRCVVSTAEDDRFATDQKAPAKSVVHRSNADPDAGVPAQQISWRPGPDHPGRVSKRGIRVRHHVLCLFRPYPHHLSLVLPPDATHLHTPRFPVPLVIAYLANATLLHSPRPPRCNAA